jgi:putative transposase
MPLGSELFAEAICARLGIRRNTGKRGRAPGEERESATALTELQGFGF